MRDAELWIVTLLLLIVALLIVGYQELTLRLDSLDRARQRIFVVHKGGLPDEEGEPADQSA